MIYYKSELSSSIIHKVSLSPADHVQEKRVKGGIFNIKRRDDDERPFGKFCSHRSSKGSYQHGPTFLFCFVLFFGFLTPV